MRVNTEKTSMPTSIVATFKLLLLHCALAAAAPVHHHRRILHQPLFPQESSPPFPAPASPNYPFSTQPNDSPFFPSHPFPPPPPSAASFASFPANISSLSVPKPSKTKSASTKLIAAAAAAAVSAIVAIVFLAVFIRFRKHDRAQRSSFNHSKTQGADTTTATCNHTPNSHHIPKLQRPSQTSSEFLYLGTLVNSHAIGGGISFNGSNTSTTNHVNDSNSGKMDSPELRPLPPLMAQYGLPQSYNFDIASSKDDEDEEFYSPKGWLNGRESSTGTGSASGRDFAAFEVENINGSDSVSSSTYTSSVPGSPLRSVTLSITPANSFSSTNSMPNSPGLIEIPTDVFLHQQIQSSPPQARDSAFQESASPCLQCSPSSEKYLPRISNVSDQDAKPPVEVNNFAQPYPTVPPPRPAIPPPPPPPPPLTQSKIQESPGTPGPPVKNTVVAVESLTLISPVELPSECSETVQKNENKESPNEKNEYLNEAVDQNEETTPKPRLKPLHWDKLRASSDREMVWDHLNSSSFTLNEEMIETLFVVNTSKPNPNEITRWKVPPSRGQDNGSRILDPKKSQNIAILLRALNVTVEEVCEGLSEGSTDSLSTELLETLMKMAPTKEEERKLKEHQDDSPIKLGAAEKFLKTVLDIPYAFRRVDSLHYICKFDCEIEYLERSFETLEAACEELRNNRMFLKLLEAVLKTGNRMNMGTDRGDAHAFKLDTLLKLADIKGADGKTTLLHFVVQEIIRSEGARLSGESPHENSIIDDTKYRKLGLQVVSRLSSELLNVKNAAAMDAEVLGSEVSKLSKGIWNILEVIKLNEATSNRFSDSMNIFIKKAEEEIIKIQAQESVALSLVKEITEYFHGNSAKEEAHPLRIFMVVRDFLTILDRVCKEVGSINERTTISSGHKFPVPVNPMLQQVSGGVLNKRQHYSDEEPSPPRV